MPDEKKPAAGGGDLEAAYQSALGKIEEIYQKTVEKESKKESKKGGN